MQALLIGTLTLMTLSLLVLCGLYAKYQYHETHKLPELRSPVVMGVSLAINYVGLTGMPMTLYVAVKGASFSVVPSFVGLFELHTGNRMRGVYMNNSHLRRIA